eukprot:PhF_6_TR23279/c0_g1_i4/m.32777
MKKFFAAKPITKPDNIPSLWSHEELNTYAKIEQWPKEIRVAIVASGVNGSTFLEVDCAAFGRQYALNAEFIKTLRDEQTNLKSQCAAQSTTEPHINETAGNPKGRATSPQQVVIVRSKTPPAVSQRPPPLQLTSTTISRGPPQLTSIPRPIVRRPNQSSIQVVETSSQYSIQTEREFSPDVEGVTSPPIDVTKVVGQRAYMDSPDSKEFKAPQSESNSSMGRGVGSTLDDTLGSKLALLQNDPAGPTDVVTNESQHSSESTVSLHVAPPPNESIPPVNLSFDEVPSTTTPEQPAQPLPQVPPPPTNDVVVGGTASLLMSPIAPAGVTDGEQSPPSIASGQPQPASVYSSVPYLTPEKPPTGGFDMVSPAPEPPYGQGAQPPPEGAKINNVNGPSGGVSVEVLGMSVEPSANRSVPTPYTGGAGAGAPVFRIPPPPIVSPPPQRGVIVAPSPTPPRMSPGKETVELSKILHNDTHVLVDRDSLHQLQLSIESMQRTMYDQHVFHVEAFHNMQKAYEENMSQQAKVIEELARTVTNLSAVVQQLQLPDASRGTTPRTGTPVLSLAEGQVYIPSSNHSFAPSMPSPPAKKRAYTPPSGRAALRSPVDVRVEGGSGGTIKSSPIVYTASTTHNSTSQREKLESLMKVLDNPVTKGRKY